MGSAKREQWEDPATDLAAVTATGAGTWINGKSHSGVRMVVTATGVTSGATVVLQGNTKPDGGGTTFTVGTSTVTGNGSTRVEATGSDTFPSYRTNITALTDGTYTTSLQVLR